MPTRTDHTASAILIKIPKATRVPGAFHDHIGLPGESIYVPGTLRPQRKSSMSRVVGRMSQFNLKLPGLGDCLFTSTEESIVDARTGLGVTLGRIAVKTVQGVQLLVARSYGKVYSRFVEGRPAVGFKGRFVSEGSQCSAGIEGEYSGYFVPDDSARPVSGLLHMDFEFETN